MWFLCFQNGLQSELWDKYQGTSLVVTLSVPSVSYQSSGLYHTVCGCAVTERQSSVILFCTPHLHECNRSAPVTFDDWNLDN